MDWTMRMMGCVIPDLDKVESGTLFQCGKEGCDKFYIVHWEESDPGPYHAYGESYKTFSRVRVYWFDRKLKRQIQSGNYLSRDGGTT